MKTYAVTPNLNCLVEMVQMRVTTYSFNDKYEKLSLNQSRITLLPTALDMYHIHLVITHIFPLQNNPKNEDPSHKIVLRFWNCFRSKNSSYSKIAQDLLRYLGLI